MDPNITNASYRSPGGVADRHAVGGETSCCPDLIQALDRAVEAGPMEAITERVERALVESIAGREFSLSGEMRRRAADSYARRLVYRSPDLGYTVVAMVWGPGQATPIHDHDGVWCVECVFEGQIEVTQYDLLESAGERCFFRAQGSIAAGVGSAGKLIPPFDYHTIANRGDVDAITIHVYGKELEQCRVFEPCGDDWYQSAVRQLGYTD